MRFHTDTPTHTHTDIACTTVEKSTLIELSSLQSIEKFLNILVAVTFKSNSSLLLFTRLSLRYCLQLKLNGRYQSTTAAVMKKVFLECFSCLLLFTNNVQQKFNTYDSILSSNQFVNQNINTIAAFDKVIILLFLS